MMKKVSMKAKTITRIADQIAKSKSQYNEEGGTYQPTPKDFARLTWFLEKILLPHHVEQYTQKDLENYITQFLEHKGHTIEPEHDELIDATKNPEIYTIHSTHAEKQAEKAKTKQLLTGQMPCPNCGQDTLKEDLNNTNPEYPTNFKCYSCGNQYLRKDLVSPDAQKGNNLDENISSIFYG